MGTTLTNITRTLISEIHLFTDQEISSEITDFEPVKIPIDRSLGKRRSVRLTYNEFFRN